MTIDEAIKHAEEVANDQELKSGFETDYEAYSISDDERKECKKCADEHRQLAEWLKDYKRLLGAIDAIKADIEELSKHPDFGDLSVGVSCGAIRCLEMINKHIEGDAK